MRGSSVLFDGCGQAVWYVTSSRRRSFSFVVSGLWDAARER